MMLVPWKGGFTQIWFDFHGINVGKSTIPMDPIGLSPFDFHSIHLLALYLARLGCPGQEGEDQWVITLIQLMEDIRHPPVYPVLYKVFFCVLSWCRISSLTSISHL